MDFAERKQKSEDDCPLGSCAMLVRRNYCESQYYSYCYGVVLHKASQALQPFSDILCIPHLSSYHS
jgi:hypothetical protein